MTEEHSSGHEHPHPKEDEVQVSQEHTYQRAVVSEKSGVSFIWIVPIIALLVGLGLVYKAFTSRGPLVTVTFKSADGIEAKKTKVKYKDVVIGKVKSVEFTEGFSHVRVKVRLVKDAEEFLSANTRFWIVRPRMRGATVSGLDTLLSGAYVAVDPGKKGEEQFEFTGLEVPPIVTRETGGKLFTLRAEALGSLDYGSPVYYRGINVGQVVGYRLEHTGKAVDIQVFIDRPYDVYVQQSSRFWSVSGFDFELGSNGVHVHSKSLVSIMVGGIAFMAPPHLGEMPIASAGEMFTLYNSRRAAMSEVFVSKKYYALKFDQTVRGLEVGDPVEFKGFPIGRVVRINAEFDWDRGKVFVIVRIEVEEERLKRIASGIQGWGSDHVMRVLVDQGLRAQVLSANLLTGKRYVSLDLIEKATPAVIETTQEGLMQLPTIPTPIEELTAYAFDLLDKFKRVPINDIARHTLILVRDLKGTIAQLNKVVASIDKVVASRDIKATLRHTRRAMHNAYSLIAKDSRTVIELQRALRELSDAAKSFRNLADQLERNPESLIHGKR